MRVEEPFLSEAQVTGNLSKLNTHNKLMSQNAQAKNALSEDTMRKSRAAMWHAYQKTFTEKVQTTWSAFLFVFVRFPN